MGWINRLKDRIFVAIGITPRQSAPNPVRRVSIDYPEGSSDSSDISFIDHPTTSRIVDHDESLDRAPSNRPYMPYRGQTDLPTHKQTQQPFYQPAVDLGLDPKIKHEAPYKRPEDLTRATADSSFVIRQGVPYLTPPDSDRSSLKTTKPVVDKESPIAASSNPGSSSKSENPFLRPIEEAKRPKDFANVGVKPVEPTPKQLTQAERLARNRQQDIENAKKRGQRQLGISDSIRLEKDMADRRTEKLVAEANARLSGHLPQNSHNIQHSQQQMKHVDRMKNRASDIQYQKMQAGANQAVQLSADQMMRDKNKKSDQEVKQQREIQHVSQPQTNPDQIVREQRIGQAIKQHGQRRSVQLDNNTQVREFIADPPAKHLLETEGMTAERRARHAGAYPSKPFKEGAQSEQEIANFIRSKYARGERPPDIAKLYGMVDELLAIEIGSPEFLELTRPVQAALINYADYNAERHSVDEFRRLIIAELGRIDKGPNSPKPRS